MFGMKVEIETFRRGSCWGWVCVVTREDGSQERASGIECKSRIAAYVAAAAWGEELQVSEIYRESERWDDERISA